MKNLALLILLLPSALIAVAQSSVTLGQDNIAFHSTQAINNGNSINSNNEFTLRGSIELEWSQQNGAEKTVYEITGVTGSWTNLNEPGSVEYAVKLGTRTGKIVLYKNGNGTIRIRIETYRGNVNLVPFEFVVSSFEQSN
jgi:hypothetical protein